MPAGIPLPTLAIGKAGSINAALSSVSILSNKYPRIREKLEKYRKKQTNSIKKYQQMKSDILGIIGGGQLGMFMCIAAKKIGAKTIVFSTEKNFSAKSFATDIYKEVLMTK